MNLFRVDIRNPIIYVYENGGQLDNYLNRERGGTAGVEVNAKHSTRSLFMTLCYGNYQVVRSKTALPEMELPAPYDRSYQGVPRHKVTLVAAWKTTAQVSLETRVGWQSKAWTYQYLTEDYTWGIVEHPARLLADVGVRYRPRGVPGLSGRIGLRNILGRELSLELHYTIGR
jgi:outer membrane receptor for ferrienterochelin and colicin